MPNSSCRPNSGCGGSNRIATAAAAATTTTTVVVVVVVVVVVAVVLSAKKTKMVRLSGQDERFTLSSRRGEVQEISRKKPYCN